VIENQAKELTAPENGRVAPRACLGRVLVTGATGFIGRHLVGELCREGWEVVALTRRECRLPWPAGPRLRLVQGDLTDPATIERAVAQVDAVCHLAAFIPPDLEDPTAARPCLEVNALAALRIAELAAQRSARVVFFSSGQVYCPSDQPRAEEAPTYPVHRATYYLASKLLGELYIEHVRLLSGLPAVTLRVGSCYGLGMPERSVVARFMTVALAGLPLELWDGGVARYDFVYVDDVVHLARAALRGGAPGVYNAGSGRGTSVLELAQTLATVFADKEIAIQAHTSIQPAPARRLPPVGFAPLATDKASAAWDYRPRSLIDGLRAYRLQREAGAC